MRRRVRNCGFVHLPLQLTIVALGVWGVIASWMLSSYLGKKERHECAVRLDQAAALAVPAGSCARTEKPFVVESGRVCDPSSVDVHKQSEPMCATAAEPLAAKHPAPSGAWTAGILAVLFVVLVGGVRFLA